MVTSSSRNGDVDGYLKSNQNVNPRLIFVSACQLSDLCVLACVTIDCRVSI